MAKDRLGAVAKNRNYLERDVTRWFRAAVDAIVRFFWAVVGLVKRLFRGIANLANRIFPAVGDRARKVASDLRPSETSGGRGARRNLRSGALIAVGVILFFGIGSVVVRSMASGSDPESFGLRAETMIAIEGPIAADVPTCPDGPSEPPIDYSETSTLADELDVFNGELIPVHLVLTPRSRKSVESVTFEAAWPSAIAPDGPICTFLISNGSEATLTSEPASDGGTTFTIVNPAPNTATTVEVWLRAVDPVSGVPFSTDLASATGEVIVDPLGGRLVVEARDNTAEPTVEFPPVIQVWYGDTQPVGERGRAQKWVNVVGNVSDQDGISSFTYSLNGGPAVELETGPDQRRLVRPGDFNVQLDYDDLVEGPNQVAITAVDQTDLSTTETVILLLEDVPPPTLPFETSFNPINSILAQASVIDGPWFINEDGTVTTDVLAYDRVLGIGDVSWRDYEVSLRVTVHALGTEYQTPQSGNAASVGLGLRWVGHTQRETENPYIGFYPTGALLSHKWFSDDGWNLVGNDGSPRSSFASTPELDVTYNWRARVETVVGGTEYSFKSWAVDAVEPAEWDMQILEDNGPASGSVVLIAHHVDADFSNVTVTPLG
jgi:hypothetical protein